MKSQPETKKAESATGSIRIEKPYIVTENQKSRLVFPLRGGWQYDLWFEVEERFGPYLVTEVSDAAVVCLLLWAMEHGCDMTCEAPVSERLYLQLRDNVIPAISKYIPHYHPIRITAQICDVEFGGKAVGTGFSCGVDSFYTVLKNLEHGSGSRLQLTHLCFFNAGATGMFGGDNARRVFRERAARFSGVAQELGCEFLTCDSNMNEFLMQEHEKSHVFRTLSIPLALQKLFGLYYFSSSYEYGQFRFSEFDPAYYEIFLLPNLSNQNVRFTDFGGETTRQKKVAYIAHHDVTHRELNVCIGGVENCHSCRKCRRTMLNLYLAGVLDDFGAVFDVDWFRAHKRFMFRWALMNFWRVDMPEIVRELKKQKQLTVFDHIGAFFCFPFEMGRQILGKLRFIRSKPGRGK